MTDTTEAEAKELRSHMYKHNDAAAWLAEQGLINGDSTHGEVIAAFAAKRNEYRRTDRYRALVEAGDPANAEKEAAKAAAKEAKEAEKATKAAEREAAKVAKAEAAAAAKAEKEAAAAKAAAPAEPAKATKPAAKATGGKKTGKGAAAAPAGDDPFA